ncbi:uncharacterized protein BHQ10_004968 [Talaromyces amestolkiae]|uniref:NWD NACHT-NTPase N-terminal domain-containing protein n=1 Tax=Talaromyces amestolkiae TaxID=1196081 RepID=A0A364KZG7_TALAM|nr:uncharacterized protein BHQ10_004968 [Talaromyces amestolkiae]RAO68956.1 hypothetical protein BHQ10_004968 [Talaromyces amestolkiae]
MEATTTMASLAISRKSANDLWAEAVEQLNDSDKSAVNFSHDKLTVLVKLQLLAEKSKDECIQRRWKYTRKSGETVILRDVFEKMIAWIKTFEKVGSSAVQYDPVHAALPWAGIRFILQVAINNHDKFGEVMEGLAEIAEIICRHAILEDLYCGQMSIAAGELQRALVVLYATVLKYLSKARAYVKQRSIERMLKSGFLPTSELDDYLEKTRKAEINVRSCASLVDKQENTVHHSKMIQLLEYMETPLRKMDENLRHIEDNLQESKRRAILEWMSQEPYIQHHEQNKQGVLSGTGQWLLADSEFVKWKNERASSILWLHGFLGSGKSKLVSIVIEDALRGFRSGQTIRPVYFYCSRNKAEPGRSDPSNILASIARQLSSLEPGTPLLSPTLDLYRKKEVEGFMSGPMGLEESCSLIIELTARYSLTIIVVDALDECERQKKYDLLKALERILQESSGLVKVFVSSRNDQDFVVRLKHYPNLEISSEKNGADIALFVQTETERLVREEGLLQYSDHPIEMKNLIVKKVTDGARGMFRWASVQLQFLCSLNMDVDIRNNLGRLPPDLDTIYAELYCILSEKSGEMEKRLFKNVLSWLLCARLTLQTSAFLEAVSVPTEGNDSRVRVTKELVLKICGSLVVFDAELNTFRFAHLSVREFLERRQEYTTTATNALIAGNSLRRLMSANIPSEVDGLLSKHGLYSNHDVPDRDRFVQYSYMYWCLHFKLAGHRRISGDLKETFQRFILSADIPSGPIKSWLDTLPGVLSERYHCTQNEIKLRDTITTSGSTVSGVLFLACIFDFFEVLEVLKAEWMKSGHFLNAQNRTLFDVSVSYGNCGSLKFLLDAASNMNVSENLVETAAWSESNGEEIMRILLDKRGRKIQITPKIVQTAAQNWQCGEEIIRILLDKRGTEIQITPKIVQTAAKNWKNGGKIMKLLLDKRGTEIQITPDVVLAAVDNRGNGEEIMKVLLDKRGGEIRITPDVLRVVARNRGSGEKIMRLLLAKRDSKIQITSDFILAAARMRVPERIMNLLLEKCDSVIRITPDMVRAAVENGRIGEKVIRLLLTEHFSEVQITADIVQAVARMSGSEKFFELLLDKRGSEIQITPKIVQAAAENRQSGEEVMRILLDKRGSEIQITPDVVEAAAKNWQSGKKLVELLLDKRGTEIQISPDVVLAAANNGLHGEQIMRLLFDKCDSKIQITLEIAQTAARNWRNGEKIMEILLDKRGAEIQITPEVFRAVPFNWEWELGLWL